jgi:hypothetical protein
MRQSEVEKLAAAAWLAAETLPESHGHAKSAEARRHLRDVLHAVDPRRVYDPRSPKRTSGIRALPADEAGTHI